MLIGNTARREMLRKTGQFGDHEYLWRNFDKEAYNLYRVEPHSSEDTHRRHLLRASILSYEMGDLNRYLVKLGQVNLPTDIINGMRSDAKLAMADMIMQLRMVCFDLGWCFDEIQWLGIQHLRERHEDFKKDGWAEG